MRTLLQRFVLAFACISGGLVLGQSARASMNVEPDSVTVAVGAATTARVREPDGTVTVRSNNTAIATATYASRIITVRGVAPGSTTVTVGDSERSRTLSVRVTGAAPANQAPDGTIATPAGNVAITVGQSVSFAGTGTDPDGNTPLAFAWAFPGGSPASSTAQNPGAVSFAAAGTYTVSLTVRDALGLADPTPATRTITVNAAQPGNQAPTCTITAPAGNLTITAGQSVNFAGAGTDPDGNTPLSYSWTFPGGSPNNSTAQNPGAVSFAAAGTYTVSFTTRDARGLACATPAARTITVTAVAGSGTVPLVTNGNYTVLAANDLGMHCTDQDFQVFSILPPFNVLHAQVIQKGLRPTILSNTNVDVFYAASSAATDPAGAGSINTTSQNRTGVFKTNFWDKVSLGNGVTSTFGGAGYRKLYPANTGVCDPDPAKGCRSILDLFYPLADGSSPFDVSLPVPDPNVLPVLEPHQQAMGSVTSLAPYASSPYVANQPQKFARYDTNLAFFLKFSQVFGKTFQNVKWFASDGIPITPTDDVGRLNAYPLMRIAAVNKGALPTAANATLASVDIVVPTSAETDCKNCHADPADHGNGRGSVFSQTTTYANGATPLRFVRTADAPGPEQLNNAAKINILRLHDAKHGAAYTSSVTGASASCTSGSEESCLDKRRYVQCAQCHYTPALDLAQVGPIDETTMGEAGRQQTRHISMSRAMHGHHGQFTDLFPAMPGPVGRTRAQAGAVLQETCYQCHPGKNTQCMRGAMANGGVVCQDCHGNMEQVGADFTANFKTQPGVFDLTKRVPWAMEPKCQSCHIGDAQTVPGINKTGMLVAADGLRLLQAYLTSDAAKAPLPGIAAPTSRFAENESLYRFSSGHGGVMCKGCHGATHSEWPNPNPAANDNVTATQLQGHAGVVRECTTCHGTAVLPRNLAGPHGLHPVGDAALSSGFSRGHSGLAEQNRNACRACHGASGQGTVLSKAAVTRPAGNGRERQLVGGQPVRCDTCHGNEL